MSGLIYPEESYKIIGACFNVYKAKGCGFTEPVYQECLEIELEYQEIPFEAQKKLKLAYRGRELKQTFKPDFICYEKIVLEIKAVANLVDEHRAQLLNYLTRTSRNQKKKIKSARKVAETQRIRKEYAKVFLCDPFAPSRLWVKFLLFGI